MCPLSITPEVPNQIASLLGRLRHPRGRRRGPWGGGAWRGVLWRWWRMRAAEWCGRPIHVLVVPPATGRGDRRRTAARPVGALPASAMASPPPSRLRGGGGAAGGRSRGGDCTRRRCPRRPHAYIAVLPPAASTASRMSIKSAREPTGCYLYPTYFFLSAAIRRSRIWFRRHRPLSGKSTWQETKTTKIVTLDKIRATIGVVSWRGRGRRERRLLISPATSLGCYWFALVFCYCSSWHGWFSADHCFLFCAGHFSRCARSCRWEAFFQRFRTLDSWPSSYLYDGEWGWSILFTICSRFDFILPSVFFLSSVLMCPYSGYWFAFGKRTYCSCGICTQEEICTSLILLSSAVRYFPCSSSSRSASGLILSTFFYVS
jgi:hypothetical protein